MRLLGAEQRLDYSVVEQVGRSGGSQQFHTILPVVSSCSEQLSTQQAAAAVGTFPIQSLACRSVVSVLAHACPVRSNLLAACREMGLIKSLTEISPTPDLRRAEGKGKSLT